MISGASTRSAVGTTHAAELARYDAVILLETCATLGLYDGDESSFCRFEDAEAAIASDNLLELLWRDHPRLAKVPAFYTLEEKIAAVKTALEGDDDQAQDRDEHFSADRKLLTPVAGQNQHQRNRSAQNTVLLRSRPRIIRTM